MLMILGQGKERCWGHGDIETVENSNDTGLEPCPP